MELVQKSKSIFISAVGNILSKYNLGNKKWTWIKFSSWWGFQKNGNNNLKVHKAIIIIIKVNSIVVMTSVLTLLLYTSTRILLVTYLLLIYFVFSIKTGNAFEYFVPFWFRFALNCECTPMQLNYFTLRW